MKDLVSRVATMVMVGATVEEIHYVLTQDEGMSEYDAWLTYIAGKMLYVWRSE